MSAAHKGGLLDRAAQKTSYTAEDLVSATGFLQFIYDGQEGYLEVYYAVGDPCLRRFRQNGWYWYTHEAAATIAHACLGLAAEHGDVYVSRTCYSERRRHKDVALPSRVVFLDDAPEGECTLSVRTSQHSRHAYFKLDEPIDASAIQALQRRGARALGADKNSISAVKLVRLPGGLNTKQGACHKVVIEHASDRVYTTRELEEAWPPVARGSLPLVARSLDTTALALWRECPASLFQMRNGTHIPKRFKPHTQSYKALTGEQKFTAHNDRQRTDRSLTRAVVVKGLVMHGYPDEEIIVIAEQILDWGHIEEKGAAWFLADVCRLIAKYRAEFPSVRVTPTERKAVRREPRARATRKPQPQRKTGSPQVRCQSADDLLAYYENNVDVGRCVLQRRQQVAAALGISPATLDRFERALRERGAIRRVTASSRQHSWVELLAPDARSEGADRTAAPDQPSLGADISGVIRPAGDYPCGDSDQVLSADADHGSTMGCTLDAVTMKEHRRPCYNAPA